MWHGEGGMEKVAWRRWRGEGGMEKVAWRRWRGEGGIDVAWRRWHGEGDADRVAWRRWHRGTRDVAQWLERGNSNPKTLGSIPWQGRVRECLTLTLVTGTL